ncbi:MAG: nicotinamide mononucleotide transporter [Prevotellaceae bacterium]|jgi:nicotinamide mononucleotide transporter PnuC|nr:nicotinamide mononucleotide transporter [Prevotellaceae bacterium]
MNKLYLSALKNLLVAVLLTSALFGVILLLKISLTIDNTLLFSVIATISGVCYILTISNPKNYVGFYFGIISSAALGVQFATLGSWDMCALYFAVFIPFQYSAICHWKKKNVEDLDIQTSIPKFLSLNKRLFFLLIFILIIIIDYIFASFYLNSYKNEPFFSSFLIKMVFAIMISSSILANYLMIGKWLDSWIFWLIYSAFAMISAIIIENSFNLLLFTFFLIINAISFSKWLKARKSAMVVTQLSEN